MLLLLQNRGRMTSAALAQELEVTPRTILRDLDAMTEAGLPVIVFQGNQGGIELGFDYRTRLTGLDVDEAEAMGLILSASPAALTDLGLRQAADRARTKIWEAFPDQTRMQMAVARQRFRVAPLAMVSPDPRRAALATAIRHRRIVRLAARSVAPVEICPVTLILGPQGWAVQDGRSGRILDEADWGDINVSARQF